jgi:head-tail adaptor
VDGRYFQVVSSYDPDGRRRRLVTFCTELAR